MSSLTFRNSQGQLVDLATVPATRAKNEFGAILDTATRGGAVAITRHDRPRAVLISFDEFQALVQDRAARLGNLESAFDELLTRMQKPGARAGVTAAFKASPTALGHAAVAAARPATARPRSGAGRRRRSAAGG